MTLLQLLQLSLKFFLLHFWPICRILLLIELPALGLEIVIDDYLWADDSAVDSQGTQLLSWYNTTQLLIVLAYAIAYTASTATLIVYIGNAMQGTVLTIRQALLQGIPVWLHLFLAIIVANLFIIIGLLALILPGIYLLYRLAFVEICVVREGARVFDSIERSFELSRGRIWLILPPVLLLTLLATLVYYGADALFIATEMDNTATYILNEAVFSLTMSYLTILLYHMYEIVRQTPETA